ncbi:cobalt-factor II C(20)-methyltransferase family protein [Leptospira interrogans serovar Bataviae str. HAI135]|nr:cobalt-factor II C(20)-methyltransferase family protein [Leptospira interrogans serovar Bataviae str. HAI135]
MKHFDTIILTKVGQIIPELVNKFKKLNILKNASYVSYATTDRQKIVTDLETIQNESCDYFSTVILSIRKRKGILRGQNCETE